VTIDIKAAIKAAIPDGPKTSALEIKLSLLNILLRTNVWQAILTFRGPKTPPTYWADSLLTSSFKLPCRKVGTKDNEALRARMHKLGILRPETKESG
jgi:hypothetical protein